MKGPPRKGWWELAYINWTYLSCCRVGEEMAPHLVSRLLVHVFVLVLVLDLAD